MHAASFRTHTGGKTKGVGESIKSGHDDLGKKFDVFVEKYIREH